MFSSVRGCQRQPSRHPRTGRPASAAGAGTALQRGPHPEPRAGTQSLVWPQTVLLSGGGGMTHSQQRPQKATAPARGPPASPGMCMPRRNHSATRGRGQGTVRGGDSSTSTRRSPLGAQALLPGRTLASLPRTGPGPRLPAASWKQEVGGQRPKEQRCPRHFSNAPESRYVQKAFQIASWTHWQEKNIFKKQTKSQTGNNCWKRRRSPRDQSFGLELLKIAIRQSLLFPKFLFSI